jgi:hypothetical protein
MPWAALHSQGCLDSAGAVDDKMQRAACHNVEPAPNPGEVRILNGCGFAIPVQMQFSFNFLKDIYSKPGKELER